MKKILALLFAALVSLQAASAKYEKGYNEALSAAQKANKPVMLVISSHTCHYCDLFDKDTLGKSMVIKALDRDFVSTVVYPDSGEYVPRQLLTGATPTIWFLTPRGEPMFEPVMGAVGEADFIKVLAIVNDAFQRAR
jgi:thioredoxin-related protein